MTRIYLAIGKVIERWVYKQFYLYPLMMGEITVLTKATSKSRSLRTTIPIGIVKQFNLSEGDKLNWEIRAEDGNLIIVVKPIRVRKDDE